MLLPGSHPEVECNWYTVSSNTLVGWLDHDERSKGGCTTTERGISSMNLSNFDSGLGHTYVVGLYKSSTYKLYYG